MELITCANLVRPDDIYEALIELQDGCDEQEALKRCAKLIFCLANHIGDEEVISQALIIAKGNPDGVAA